MASLRQLFDSLSSEQRRNQDKDHLARIHVAEQTKPERKGLGQEADDFHEQVHGDK